MQEVLGLIIVLVVILVILNGVACTPPASDDAAKEYATRHVSPTSPQPDYPTDTQHRILDMLREIPVWYYFDEELRDVRYLEFSLGSGTSKAPVAIKFRTFDTSGGTTNDDFEKARFANTLEPKMWNWGPEPSTITILLTGGVEARDPEPATVVSGRGDHVIVITFRADYLLEIFEYESGRFIKNEKLQPYDL